jgi:hypothetical protein
VNYSRSLSTVVEEEKSSDVFGEALDNNINKFHHTLDAGLKKMTSHINSTKMTSSIQHKTVMQELSVLVTKHDIQKAMNAMLLAKILPHVRNLEPSRQTCRRIIFSTIFYILKNIMINDRPLDGFRRVSYITQTGASSVTPAANDEDLRLG